MARKKGKEIDGWLILDKPLGPTSTDMVNRLRWAMDARKAGHGGTLDPLASGVLPIAFGKATATIPYIMEATKKYRFTLFLGESRTTDDREGDILEKSDYLPSDDEIRSVLPRFCGNILQAPPIFSALKVNGQRSYDLARSGKIEELPPRKVRIDSVEFVERLDAHHAVFDVQSGKGVYMRSLARDIALACGSVGHISELRRTQCGPFSLKDCLTLEELRLDKRIENREKLKAFSVALLSVSTSLVDIPAVAVTEKEAKALVCGQIVSIGARSLPVPTCHEGLPLWRATLGEHVMGLCTSVEGCLKPVRMFESHLFFGEQDVDYS